MPEERRPPHGATDGIADFEAARRVREKAGCALSPPPDGGYGWVVLCANFCVNAFTWGIVASYGVYLAHYLAANVYPGSSDIDFALIGGFNFSMAMLVAPFVTIFARKYGHRLSMISGATLITSGFVAASFAHEVWALYLSQGALVGFGVGFVAIPTIAILPQWFEKKRSLATGIGSGGSGVGGLIFSFGTQAMIDNLSLAWSLRITGIVSGIMCVIAAILMRNRNKTIRPPQRGFDTNLLKRYDVLLLLAWAFTSMLGYIALLFSLSDFAHSIGLNARQAAAVSAFLNLGTAVGRPLIGLTIGPISVEVAGLTDSPSLLSLSWMSIVLPTTFSEVIALKLRRSETEHTYLYPQIFAGLAYLVASACMYELRRFKRNPKR